jgi:hypothetical protein
MTREQAIQRLLDVALHGKRHPWYQRTVDKASLYTKLATGEGLDSLMRRFANREDDDLFQQRIEITQHITESVVKNLMDVFFKVPRANFQRILTYEGDQVDVTRKVQEVEDVLGTFWGDSSLDDWMATRFLELNTTDPNAFIILEFEPARSKTELVRPYPFEVSSTEAVDYRYDNNTLQHLTAKSAIVVDDPNTGKQHDGEKLTLYLADETMTLTETVLPFKSGFYSTVMAQQEGELKWYDNSTGYVRFRTKVFRLDLIKPHLAGRVPAFRVGYVRDLATKGATCTPPYNAAIPYLMKSLKINSELDLTMTLSAFPLSIRYTEACDAEGCYNGILQNGGACQTCAGTGKKRPTSVAEEITLTLPKEGEELVDLEKLVAFKYPPVDLLKFQAEYVEKLTRKAKSIVFNTDIFDKAEVADTATGKRIDLENVYDTLSSLAVKYARSWKYCVETIARFTDRSEGLIAQIKFPKDFKLKGFNELLSDLAQAAQSEAGAAVKRNIERDLARIVFADDVMEYQRWEVREFFNPFSGMSDAEKMLALTSDLVSRRTKIMYANFGMLFDQLEEQFAQEKKDFYRMNREVQKKAIDEKVTALIEEIKPQKPTLMTA